MGGAKSGGDTEQGPEPQPILQGATVVTWGTASNKFGISVPYQIERIDEEGGPEFFAILREPWNSGNPVAIAQEPSLELARARLLTHLAADEHGAPGP